MNQPCDSFQEFLQEMGASPLLSPKEEQKLALRARAGDQEARSRLIEANLRFVVHLAKHYQGHGLDLEDLVGEGTIGLIKAVDHFDPNKEYRFTTYAYHWIRQSVTRALDNTAHPVRLPCYLSRQMAHLVTVHEHYFEQAGAEPTAEDLSLLVDLPPATIKQMFAARCRPASLDQVISRSSDLTLAEALPDESLPAHDAAMLDREEAQERHHLVARLLAYLTERERQVIRLHFGLDGVPAHTLADAGRILGISRERARQLFRAAMQKLHHLSGSASSEQQYAS